MQDLGAGTECMCAVAWQQTFPFAAADLVVPLFPFLDKICSHPTTLILMVPSHVFYAFHIG